MNGKIPETDQEKVVYMLSMFGAIKKILGNVPPYYSYGDNEAGCYMAELLQRIDEVVSNGLNFDL